jgi:hypothetical protein
MRGRFFYIAFVTLITVGLVVFYIVRAGYYPVAIVGTSFITERTYRIALDSATHYYIELSKAYGSAELPESFPKSTRELRRVMLDRMIENELVARKFAEQVGKDATRLIEEKFKPLNVASKEFAEGVSTLYGLSIPRFRELVLEPRARAEILEERMANQATVYKAWLVKARQSTNVIILASDLRWDGEKVVMQN